jgi:hypothetical protein
VTSVDGWYISDMSPVFLALQTPPFARLFMGHRDRVDLSKLSILEQARLSALIEVDGDPGLRAHLLGAVGRSTPLRRREREVPAQWTIIYVLDRLEEAVEVRAMMPASTRPKEFGAAWPTYTYDRFDLNSQMETEELEKTLADRNKVRLQPSAAQISRAEEAERWPFEFLADRPELARAIGLRTLWSVMKIDIRKRCLARGIDHAEFNVQWQAALSEIAGKLIARKVPVS